MLRIRRSLCKATETIPTKPRNMQQALDALLDKRLPLSPEQLEALCGFPATPGTPLAAALAASERVDTTSKGLYVYKAGRLCGSPAACTQAAA